MVAITFTIACFIVFGCMALIPMVAEYKEKEGLQWIAQCCQCSWLVLVGGQVGKFNNYLKGERMNYNECIKRAKECEEVEIKEDNDEVYPMQKRN